jgi:CrcB protein
VCRFALYNLLTYQLGDVFPWGTLIINVTGSFLIGLFATLTGPDGAWLVRTEFRSFFMIGICGGYTTFSAYSLETLRLANEGQWAYVAMYIVFSNLGCLSAVWLGHLCARFKRR